MTLRLATATAGLLAAGLAVGLAVAIGVTAVGTLPFVALIGAVLGAGLLAFPRIALAALVVAITVVEGDEKGFLAGLQRTGIYQSLPGLPLAPFDLLMAGIVAAVALRAVRRRRLVLPDPLTFPLILLGSAVIVGGVHGFFDPAGSLALLIDQGRRLAYLVLLPFVVVNLLETRRDVHLALGVGIALVVYKAATGMLGWLLGAGRTVEGTVLTYYQPLPNLLLLIFILIVGAALLSRAAPPRLTLWLTPLAIAVLILSFRRNWWIGLVLGTIVVMLAASGRRGRALVIPAGAAMVVALYIGFGALAKSESNNPIVQRAQSLDPSALQAQSDDRYRLDEQRNVAAEIRAEPVLGLGLGVPWTVRYPLSENLPGAQDYVHMALVWYWLKLGMLGLLGYLAVTFTVVSSGFRLWRTGSHAWYRAVGLGFAAAVLGLMLAETSSSFTGVEARSTILFATGAGIVCVLLRISASEASSPPPPVSRPLT